MVGHPPPGSYPAHYSWIFSLKTNHLRHLFIHFSSLPDFQFYTAIWYYLLSIHSIRICYLFGKVPGEGVWGLREQSFCLGLPGTFPVLALNVPGTLSPGLTGMAGPPRPTWQVELLSQVGRYGEDRGQGRISHKIALIFYYTGVKSSAERKVSRW